jgi:hypothetical protein
MHGGQNPLLLFTRDTLVSERQQLATHVYTKYDLIKTLAILLGSLAGVPFIAPAKKAAGDNTEIGITFATASVLTFGISAIWALSNIFVNLKRKSPAEQQLVKQSKRYTLFKHTTSNLLGMLASVPLTYAIYKYNGNRIHVAIAFFADYGFKTFGYYEAFDSASKLKFLCSRNKYYGRKAATKFKNTLIGNIKYTIIPSLLIDKTTDVYNSIVVQNGNPSAEELLGLLLRPNIALLEKHHATSQKSTMKNAFIYLAMILPFCNAVKDFLLSREAASEFSSVEIVKSLFSLITVLPGLALGLLVTKGTAAKITNLIQACNSKTPQTTMTSFYYPKIYYATPLIALVLTSLAATGDSFISYDTLENTDVTLLNQLTWLFTITTFLGNVIFHSFAMREVSDYLMGQWIEFFVTNDEIKKESRAIKCLQFFSRTLTTIEPARLDECLHTLRDDPNIVECLSLDDDVDDFTFSERRIR